MPYAFSGTKEGRNDHRIRALSTGVHLDLSPGTEPLGDLFTLKATFSWWSFPAQRTAAYVGPVGDPSHLLGLCSLTRTSALRSPDAQPGTPQTSHTRLLPTPFIRFIQVS